MNTLISTINEFLDGQHHGWCSPEKAHALASIIVAMRPKVTVEIGVYAGRSGISMAMAHKFINYGQVIGIDPFTNQAAAEGYEGENAKWWGELDIEDILRQFNERIGRYHLEPYFQLQRVKSDDAPVPDVICCLHVDGQHTEQAVRDVERFASHVRIGGIVIMDDIQWDGGGVTRAVSRLMDLGFVEMYRIADWGVFQRIIHSSI
jgi:hypothetical protein